MVGFYLKAIRDRKLFQEAGYQNFEEIVRDKYDLDKGSICYFFGFFAVNLGAAGASAGALLFLHSGWFWTGLLLISLILIGRWLGIQARRGAL